MAYGRTDAKTQLWDLDSGQKITLLVKGYVAFSPDSHTLAIGTDEDMVIHLWDVETGQLKATLEGHTSWVTSVAFSPDGTLASASYDGTILLWDMSPFVTDPFDLSVVSTQERAVPVASGLGPNAPNPFNIITRIFYRMAAPGPVLLEIYNILGQSVYKLVDQFQAAGRYQVYWNGQNQSGEAVAAGVYFARLQYPDGVQTRRLVLLK